MASSVTLEKGVMFRRSAFYADGVDSKPKWHIYDHRGEYTNKRTGEHHENVSWVLVAMCGYSYEFALEEPLLRRTIKDMDSRCRKCDRALSEETGEPMPRPKRRRPSTKTAVVRDRLRIIPPDPHLPYDGGNPDVEAGYCLEHGRDEWLPNRVPNLVSASGPNSQMEVL